jgi:hypothetical protein
MGVGEKQKPQIPVHGGMLNEGDPALAAEGVCEVLKNVEYIDQGLYARQPFINDYAFAGAPLGLFRWEDTDNRIVRMMAVLASEGASGRLIVKDSAGGEAWTQIGTDGNVAALPVSAYANYRGIVYFCLNDGASVPLNVYSYDGTTLRAGTPVPGLTAGLVCVFGERVFYGNLRFVIVNQLGATAQYDPTTWTLTGCAATKVATTVSGRTAVVWRLAPTAATGAKAELSSAITIADSADVTKLVLLAMFMGIDSAYRMPMTIELVFRGLTWETNHVYVLGVRRHPVTPNGYVYVVTAAGTSHATTEPTWPTTIGTEVTDNGTLKWKCESVDVIVHEVIEVPSTSDSTDPAAYYIDVVIPPVVSSYVLMLRYSFGTTSTPSVSLIPIGFSMNDGGVDLTPIKKSAVQNFGQQLTISAFKFPFAGTSGSSATLLRPDMGIWSEPGEPDVLLADNTVLLVEQPGDIKSMFVAGGRLWWGKRRALWSFLLQKDPVFPILREKVYNDIGSISPKGADTLDDLAFVMGEDQIFGFDAGQAPIAPLPLLPEALRRTVMDHGATWVESISASDGQHYMPILRVHPTRRQLWVHTQDRKIFVYDIPGKRWAYFEIPKTGSALARIRDIEWNPTTRRMMVMCENGITRHAHRRELGNVAVVALTAGGTGYTTPPTVTLSAPTGYGRSEDDTLVAAVQATATATVVSGAVTLVTVTNPGSGYVAPPTVAFSGGGGTGAAATARLMRRDTDVAQAAYSSEKRIRPKPYEVRPDRAVMTVEDVAIYGKILLGQSLSTCEMDISFDGGETFTLFNQVRLAPLSAGAKRRYPIPVRKTGESLVIDVIQNGDTGADVFNVLDMDAQIIVRGKEQPKTRPTGVAKAL